MNKDKWSIILAWCATIFAIYGYITLNFLWTLIGISGLAASMYTAYRFDKEMED